MKNYSFSLPSRAITAFIFPFGTRFDELGKGGVTHLIEHLIIESSGSRFEKDFKKTLEKEGTEVNAATYKDKFIVYAISETNKANFVEKTLLDQLALVDIEPDVFEKERGVVLQEYDERFNETESVVDREGARLLFGTNTLSIPSIGIRDDIKHITFEDADTFMKAYIAPHYAHQVFLSVPDFHLSLKEAELPFMSETTHVSSHPLKSHRVNITAHTTSKQAYIGMYFKTIPDGDGATIPLRLLHSYLAGLFSSVLIQKLREELGIVYDITTDSDYYVDTGYFSIRFWCDSRHIETALKATNETLTSIATGNVDCELLQTSKEHYAMMWSYLDTVPDTVGFFSRSLLYNIPLELPADAIRATNAVTPNEFSNVVGRYINPDRAQIVVATGS